MSCRTKNVEYRTFRLVIGLIVMFFVMLECGTLSPKAEVNLEDIEELQFDENGQVNVTAIYDSDEDYNNTERVSYKVNIPCSGIIRIDQITIRSTNPSHAEEYRIIVDDEKSVLSRGFALSGMGAQAFKRNPDHDFGNPYDTSPHFICDTMNIFVQKGVYYISYFDIALDSEISECSYRCTFLSSNETNPEGLYDDRYDDLSSAKAVLFDKKDNPRVYRGQISSLDTGYSDYADKVDFYSFTVGQKTKVKITINDDTPLKRDEYSLSTNVFVLSESGQRIMDLDEKTDIPYSSAYNDVLIKQGSNDLYYDLDAGKYYLQVAGGYAYMYSFTIRSVASSISIDKKTVNLSYIGDKTKLTATVRPSNAYDREVVWSVDNTDVIKLTNDGTIEAIGYGLADVKAETTDGLLYATCRVSVAGDISYCDIDVDQDEYVFTGKAITPSICVYDNGILLFEGEDYSVSYSDNINVGSGIIIVEGINGFTGSTSKTFTIKQKSISTVSIPKIDEQPYTGKSVEPKVSIVDNAYSLVEGKDYSVTYSDNIDEGEASVTYKGIGNYTGSVKKTFTIKGRKIDDARISLAENQFEYTGSPIKPKVEVVYDSNSLSEGVDYSLSYGYNTNVGTAVIYINGLGDYEGVVSKNFTITKRNLKNVYIPTIETQKYTGVNPEPKVFIRNNGTVLVEGKDYAVSYRYMLNVGKGYVSYTGIGNYEGTVEKSFDIVKELSDLVIMPINDCTYSGEACEPLIIIKDGEYTLRENIDYTYYAWNNVGVGSAFVHINGRGNYTGIISKSFTINRKRLSVQGLKFKTKNYDGSRYMILESQTPSLEGVVSGDIVSVSTKSEKYVVSGDANVGSKQVKLSASAFVISGEDASNYEIVDGAVVKGTIKKAEIKTATFTGLPASRAYTGKAVVPAVTGKNGTKKLKKGTDYTVTYSNNVNVGKATIKITGKGNYTGTVTKTFKILPKGTSIKTVTADANSFTATWTQQKTKMKNTYITGYQIQYSTTKGFTKNNKTVTVTKYSSKTKTVKNLLKNKTYYVRIRTYKTINGVKYYSAWSATKTVKTKKYDQNDELYQYLGNYAKYTTSSMMIHRIEFTKNNSSDGIAYDIQYIQVEREGYKAFSAPIHPIKFENNVLYCEMYGYEMVATPADYVFRFTMTFEDYGGINAVTLARNIYLTIGGGPIYNGRYSLWYMETE